MNICLITPSYAGDLEQFALLRQTIEIFAPSFDHLAIVHSEDYRLFKNRFGSSPRLKLVKTCDVLPSYIEARRHRYSQSKFSNSLRKIFYRSRISGWHAQQLSKIYALARCDYDAAAFIDSDLMICKPLSINFFLDGNKVKCYRKKACTAEELDFDISTHEIFCNPLHSINELHDFIFQPSVFRKSTAEQLLKELENRHGQRWINVFTQERRPSEYNLLGYIATQKENLSGYQLVTCTPEDIHYSIRFQGDQVKFLDQIKSLNSADAIHQRKPFFLVQSTLKMDHRLLEEALKLHILPNNTNQMQTN